MLAKRFNFDLLSLKKQTVNVLMHNEKLILTHFGKQSHVKSELVI